MALTAVAPVAPTTGKLESDIEAPAIGGDGSLLTRINLTRPPDRDNELIKVAAAHGPAGILAVLRARRDYSWFVTLGLRSIEVCLGPRGPQSLPCLQECDPVAFGMQMLEMEVIDEIFLLMRQFDNMKDVQRSGLAIIELLIMDDPDWRDEIARKGGVALLCDIAKQRKDSSNIMCQVMTCMSYLAAEDYIEIMLGQHDALEYVAYALRYSVKNIELVTRAMLALLNLTVCEAHVEELTDKDAVPLVVTVLEVHPDDVHVAIITCGVLANLSISDDARAQLAECSLFPRVRAAMDLDPRNTVLQVAGMKALVNYTYEKRYYQMMQAVGIDTHIENMMLNHADDQGVQKYGNFFFGDHTSCPIL